MIEDRLSSEPTNDFRNVLEYRWENLCQVERPSKLTEEETARIAKEIAMALPYSGSISPSHRATFVLRFCRPVAVTPDFPWLNPSAVASDQ